MKTYYFPFLKEKDTIRIVSSIGVRLVQTHFANPNMLQILFTCVANFKLTSHNLNHPIQNLTNFIKPHPISSKPTQPQITCHNLSHLKHPHTTIYNPHPASFNKTNLKPTSSNLNQPHPISSNSTQPQITCHNLSHLKHPHTTI